MAYTLEYRRRDRTLTTPGPSVTSCDEAHNTLTARQRRRPVGQQRIGLHEQLRAREDQHCRECLPSFRLTRDGREVGWRPILGSDSFKGKRERTVAKGSPSRLHELWLV